MVSPQPDVNEQPAQTAKFPFDDKKADFVLISSDNFAFYVYSSLLSLVSPVFEVLFTLPQGVEQELYEGKPFVKVTDESGKLQLLLTWCDPRCSTQPIDDPLAVLEIADKYGMEGTMKNVTASLLEAKHLIVKNPLRIFAIAVRFRQTKLAEAAAVEAIKVPFLRWKRCEEMKHISAFAYDSLIGYRARCCAAAQGALTNIDWFRTNDHHEGGRFLVTMPCRTTRENEDSQCVMQFMSAHNWVGWFVDYLQLLEDALQQRAAGAVAVDLELLGKAICKIACAECERCPVLGSLILLDVAPIFAKEIDKRIEDVPFKLEYA